MKKNILQIILMCFFILITSIANAQHPSETLVEKDKYGSETLWSCADKHFGYYFISYSLPIPIEKSIESNGLSHSLKFGYTYRYKLADFFDIGAELSYTNRTSRIADDSMLIFDPANFYSSIKTYQNSFGTSLYFRFNLGKQTYRNLGYFIDLGGFYNYNLWKGIEYKLNSTELDQTARFKNSDYLNSYDYGGFIRFSFSNIAIIVSYTPTKWITNFTNQNLEYTRSPLMLGIQMNLYAK